MLSPLGARFEWFLERLVARCPGTSAHLYEAAVTMCYRLICKLATTGDVTQRKTVLNEGGLEYFINVVLPTPDQSAGTGETLRVRRAV